MNIIAHRGNLTGKSIDRENSPSYIMEAISHGFDVEVDVWFTKEKFYLGHDEPQYEVDSSFFTNPKLWCHAKNSFALSELLNIKAHCFWHQNDYYTLTSRMIPWCIPGKWINGGITVVFNNPNEIYIHPHSLGICVDNHIEWRKTIK